MYYFKTIPEQCLKPKVSNSLLENTKTSAIHRWPWFSNPNSFNIKRKPSRKTNPLLLFVNLLMKHGKKGSALRILSTTLYLFKARISKIKLEKTEKQYTVNYRKFKYSFGCWRNTYPKAIISDYSIKPAQVTGILSSQKGICSLRASVKTTVKSNYKKLPISSLGSFCKQSCPKGLAKHGLFLSKADPFPLESAASEASATKGQLGVAKLGQPNTPVSLFASISADNFQYTVFPDLYRKVFPFFYNFCFLQDFYISKNYLRGKCLNLNIFKIELDNRYIFHKLVNNEYSKNKYLAKTLSNSKTLVGAKTKKLENTLFCQKSISHGGRLWYKNFEKNLSWDFLTSPQKTTLLYCLYRAISNIKPPLECRTKRIGGSNKQIPGQISEHRQWGLAIRWIIEAANNLSKKRSENGEKSYRPVACSHYNHKSYGRGDKSKYPRRKVFDKTINSLLEKTIKGGSLKERISKTRSYRFCFFLADSLENAYYKKGPAMQKRNLCIEAALTHRAFLRYRWW